MPDHKPLVAIIQICSFTAAASCILTVQRTFLVPVAQTRKLEHLSDFRVTKKPRTQFCRATLADVAEFLSSLSHSELLKQMRMIRDASMRPGILSKFWLSRV